MNELIHSKVEYLPKEDLTVHPAAEYFPKMGTSDFNAFAADVKKNGIQEPIIINAQRQVLDGRHRLEACKKAGIDSVPTRLFEGDETQIMDYVISANLTRRHLRETERAIVAARLLKKVGRGSMAEKQVAMKFNVGLRSVQRARAVERDGCKGLQDRLNRGELTLGTAAEIVKLPMDEQEKVTLLSPQQIREKASQLRRVKLSGRNDSDLDPRELGKKYQGRVEKLVNEAMALPQISREVLLYQLTRLIYPGAILAKFGEILREIEERKAREKEGGQLAARRS